jgi:hypothetical protein
MGESSARVALFDRMFLFDTPADPNSPALHALGPGEQAALGI